MRNGKDSLYRFQLPRSRPHHTSQCRPAPRVRDSKSGGRAGSQWTSGRAQRIRHTGWYADAEWDPSREPRSGCAFDRIQTRAALPKAVDFNVRRCHLTTFDSRQRSGRDHELWRASGDDLCRLTDRTWYNGFGGPSAHEFDAFYCDRIR